MAAKQQTKSKRKKKKKNASVSNEVIGIIYIAISLFALSHLGFLGFLSANAFRFFVGDTYLFAAVMLGVYGGYLLLKGAAPPLKSHGVLGLILLYSGVLLFLHALLFKGIIQPETNILSATLRFYMADASSSSIIHSLGGGMIGALLYTASYFLASQWGSYLLSIVLGIVGIFFILNLSFQKALAIIRNGLQWTKKKSLFFISFIQETISKKKQQKTKKKEKAKNKTQSTGKKEKKEKVSPSITSAEETREHDQPAAKGPVLEIDSYQKKRQLEEAEKANATQAEQTDDQADENEHQTLDFEISAETENEDYQLPSPALLNEIKQKDQSGEYEIIEQNVKKLETTFASFGVDAKVVKAKLGPAVTKYEVKPAIGVKVSKVVNLTDDLALSLAAKDIRMEAPIPGKSFIGIEVPNNEVNLVSFRDVIEDYVKDNDKLLEVPLGRDISGSVAVADLTKMPHLLVAGSTGSGKSVNINSIIVSILMKAKPNEVKLMMIDPKKVELNVYNGIPHLLTPVVTNPKKAAQALHKVVEEMERRYELFAATGMRNISGYNEHILEKNIETGENYPTLPFIVVIVDELADLMMVASNAVEEAITRLAQMARAAGIHMILATQRPSVDVITGIIKANVPSRIAFAVSSGTDSRTILDSNGAEKLLGRGDMLYLPMGQNKPTRVQGAFISDEEVERVVSFVTNQQEANYVEEMIPTDEPEMSHEEAEDELYNEAVSLVVEMQTASISMLQRRFRIGYNRAARMMDEMEMRGVVGPSEGSKPRKVNVEKEPEPLTESEDL